MPFRADALDGGVWGYSRENLWHNFDPFCYREVGLFSFIFSPSPSVKTNRRFFTDIGLLLCLWALGCLHSWVSLLLSEDGYVLVNAGTLTLLIFLSGFFSFTSFIDIWLTNKNYISRVCCAMFWYTYTSWNNCFWAVCLKCDFRKRGLTVELTSSIDSACHLLFAHAWVIWLGFLPPSEEILLSKYRLHKRAYCIVSLCITVFRMLYFLLFLLFYSCLSFNLDLTVSPLHALMKARSLILWPSDLLSLFSWYCHLPGDFCPGRLISD